MQVRQQISNLRDIAIFPAIFRIRVSEIPLDLRIAVISTAAGNDPGTTGTSRIIQTGSARAEGLVVASLATNRQSAAFPGVAGAC